MSTVPNTFQNMATIKFHDGHKTAPILSSGNVSPAIIAQFLEYLNAYFHKAKIATDNDKVRNSLTCFQDIRIDNWIKNNRERFLKEDYTFTDFTTELRKRFLDPQWESMIVRNVVNCQMTNTEPFSDYANRVMAGNNLLIGTNSRLEPKDLRAKLEINMAGYLADKISRLRPADKDRITSIEVFEDWYDEICIIDREATSDLKRIADFTAEHWAKRQRTEPSGYTMSPLQHSTFPNVQHNPPYLASGANAVNQGYHPYAAQNSHTQNNAQPRNTTSNARKRTRCPKLLPSEAELLDKHDGCRKCRRFYVGHRVFDCPNEFPNPDNYITLTENMALLAQNNTTVASTFHPSTLGSNNFTFQAPPTNFASPSFSAMSYIPPPATAFTSSAPSAFVEEVSGDSSTQRTNVVTQNTSIAAMLPSSGSFALGTGSSDTESQSTVSPISSPHYLWRAHAYGTADFPLTIDCLLDNVAHLVLIRPETVADLGLPVRKLKVPQCATLAINSVRQTFLLYDYVVVSLSSLNNAWTSRPVRALIAKDLCTNILLGLPFLKHNSIVIDHELDTVIDKKTGFDLLNENKALPLLSPSTPLMSPKAKRDSILHIRRKVLEELKWKCAARCKTLEKTEGFELIAPFNPICLIKERIEILASIQHLQKLDSNIKEEYNQIFNPIPHVDLLPDHEPARIHLKEAYKKISLRSYPCPRQYREAFATLIQQRVNSGFIRPSSSSYVSPSFCVPKKDKNALPRWVCDYRQLNSYTIPDNYPLP